MSLEDKRERVEALCIATACENDCPLCGTAWDHRYPYPGCLNIDLFEAKQTREKAEFDVGRFIPAISPVENDPVNHPAHYTSGDIECIDAIAASMTPPEYEGFLKGQVIKYVWRYRLKGKPVEDLKKAAF